MKKLNFVLILLFLASCALHAQQAVRVTVTGKGDPILLLGGFSTNGDQVWKSTVEQLSPNYECHVINYAGFAGEQPVEFPWLPKVLKSIENYILEQNLDGTVIIGHSLGGTLGLELASNLNLPISKLLIIDALPASGALMFPNYDPAILQYDSPFNNQTLQMTDEQFSQMATAMANGMATLPENQKKIEQWIETTDRKTYVYGFTDYLKFDVRESLKEIRIPVMILAAGKPYGEATARANYKKQYENLSTYELFFHADSAHFIMMDQPEWYMDQVQAFLK